MKKISLKKILGILFLALIVILVLDIIFNWDEAVKAFYKGYNEMNTIQQNRNKTS